MCGGGMISMLPVVTLHVFGLVRGHQLYGYMYSVMGCASFMSAIAVKLWQKKMGIEGMLYLCAGFSLISGVSAALYSFARVSYIKLAADRGIRYDIDSKQ